MKYLMIFIISFIFVYSLYFFTVILKKNKKDKYIKGKQLQFFIKKYGLKFKNISYSKFINILSLINSLIMSVTIVIVILIKGLFLKFLIALIVLIILILICYSLLGLYIEKKEGK